MPLYEFRCEECGAEQECLVNNQQEQRILRCLNCGSPELTKLMSSFAIKRGAQPKAASPQIEGQKHCAICEKQIKDANTTTEFVPALRVKIDSKAGTAELQRGTLEIRRVGRDKPTDQSKLN